MNPFNKTTLRVVSLSMLLMLITISCTQDVNPDDLFKNESKLTLNIYKADSELTEKSGVLEMDSPKVNKLRSWFDNNKTDWRNSLSSVRFPYISVIGDNFTLLILKDFVVVEYTDSEGKQVKLTKQSDYDDFDFLKE